VQEKRNSAGAREARETLRTNMYVAALLSCDGSSSPAKIRNMSAEGCLVEAPVVPPAGSLVRLARGSLAAEGVIAWTLPGRCGIKFRALLEVQQWMAPSRNGEQARIDQTVSVLKAGALPLSGPHRPVESAPTASELAGDVNAIARLVETLGSELAEDERIVRDHGPKLQAFEIAVQTLEVVANLLTGGCDIDPNLPARLANLRVSRAQII
jgi:hypothetical protein